MRKIEQQMMDAIRNRKNWAGGNTQVRFDAEGGWWCKVYLHGNHIADFDEMLWRATVNLETLKQWPTMTTKSRLRALGVDLVQKQGRLFINNQEV